MSFTYNKNMLLYTVALCMSVVQLLFMDNHGIFKDYTFL